MNSIALECHLGSVVNFKGERRFPNTPIVAITRVNLWSKTYIAGELLPAEKIRLRKPDEILDPETQLRHQQWEESRLAVFNSWCLPSVACQSLLPDKWYILFDEHTSPSIDKEIEYLQQYNWIRPLKVPRHYGFANFTPFLFEAITSDFPDYERMMLFRLDSDDSIGLWYFEANEGFMGRADELGLSKNQFYINNTFGVLRQGANARALLNTTAFVASVCNHNTPLINPYGVHKRLRADELCIEVLTERPMWCQHLHDSSIGYINTEKYLFMSEFSKLAFLFYLHKPANALLPIPLPDGLPLATKPWLES